jgi:hypothetical protein
MGLASLGFFQSELRVRAFNREFPKRLSAVKLRVKIIDAGSSCGRWIEFQH